MSREYVFPFERIIEDLFEEVYPRNPSSITGTPERGFKPIICLTLGHLVPDINKRNLLQNRSYHKIDLQDFMEYGTSELPPPPKLGQFPEGEALFYEFFNVDCEDAVIQGTFLNEPVGISILDAVITRYKIFVSVTMRLAFKENLQSKHSKNSLRNEWLDHMGARVEEVVTVTFAPSPEEAKLKNNFEECSLVEWDRYAASPPLHDEKEWCFTVAEGVYTESLMDEIRNDPAGSYLLSSINKIKNVSDKFLPQYNVQFELARFGLLLPSYLDFMYDLVVTERVSVEPKTYESKNGEQKKSKLSEGPIYKLVKSIRIIRSKPSRQSYREWRSPVRAHAVRAHWRHYTDSTVKGHDPQQNVVLGKTWISPHIRGGNVLPIKTKTEHRDPQVIIKVKQTLAYARDLIRASEKQEATIKESHSPAWEGSKIKEKPSDEWQANERAKLTAGLRYLILKRDGFKCQLCGASPSTENYVRLEVDHKKPVSEWGETTEENLWALCRQCNRGKSNYLIC